MNGATTIMQSQLGLMARTVELDTMLNHQPSDGDSILSVIAPYIPPASRVIHDDGTLNMEDLYVPTVGDLIVIALLEQVHAFVDRNRPEQAPSRMTRFDASISLNAPKGMRFVANHTNDAEPPFFALPPELGEALDAHDGKAVMDSLDARLLKKDLENGYVDIPILTHILGDDHEAHVILEPAEAHGVVMKVIPSRDDLDETTNDGLNDSANETPDSSLEPGDSLKNDSIQNRTGNAVKDTTGIALAPETDTEGSSTMNGSVLMGLPLPEIDEQLME